MRVLPLLASARSHFATLAGLSWALSAALFGSLITPDPAMAYPVDCSILLCLAGGFPASIECAHARAVMIARITPWPIEPPLQIWNCPMRIEYRQPGDGPAKAIPVLQEVSLPLSRPDFAGVGVPALVPVQDQADVDISGPSYDFVRSMRVTNVDFYQHRSHDGDCNRTTYVRLGLYGPQGDFHWARGSLDQVPDRSRFNPPKYCSDYSFRSVILEWRDTSGEPGFEEVTY